MRKKMILAAALLVCTALVGAQAGQGGQGGNGGQGGGQGRGQGRGGFGGGQRGFGGQFGGFGGGQSELQLAFRKDVQTDLGVSADQKTKLDELQAKQRQGRGGQGGAGGRGGNGGGAGGNGGGAGGNGGNGGGAGGNGGNGGGVGGGAGAGGNGGAGGGGRGGFGGGGFGGQGGGNFNSAEFQKRMEEQRAQQHKDLAAILNEGQMKRLAEIRVQLQGTRALMQADTQKALGLSTEQVTKITDLQTKQREANMALGQKVQSGEMQREDLMKAVESNNKILEAELLKVLTADQASKFKAMSGKPFKADPPQQGRGGGNRGGGG